uniref:Protein EFR3 n=1 Tax=Lygus hesperus TaxID=30085 RepID=A0A0A9WKL8_LYGHE
MCVIQQEKQLLSVIVIRQAIVILRVLVNIPNMRELVETRNVADTLVVAILMATVDHMSDTVSMVAMAMVEIVRMVGATHQKVLTTMSNTDTVKPAIPHIV